MQGEFALREEPYHLRIETYKHLVQMPSTNLVEAKEHGDTTITHVHNCHNEDEDVELVETLQRDDWHLTLPQPRKI